MTKRRKEAAGVEVTTEGLLDELLSILSGTNGILSAIDMIELGIHEASAEGEPVSDGANDVINLLDSVRGDYERARETLLGRLDVLVGKGTPEPIPEPIEDEEMEDDLEEDIEELVDEEA
jgi:hypothetical protein